jgi:predicted methyltransferase
MKREIIYSVFRVSGFLGACIVAAALTSAAYNQAPYRQPEAGEYIKILEDPHRIERLKPLEIIRQIGLKPGDTVADIGSGSGLFTRPMARAVAPRGIVFAVDIDGKLLEHVTRTAAADARPWTHQRRMLQWPSVS